MPFSFADYASDHGVKYFLVSFTDLSGSDFLSLVHHEAGRTEPLFGSCFAELCVKAVWEPVSLGGG